MVSYIQSIFLRGSLLEILLVAALAGAIASLSSCTLARLPVLLGLVSSKSHSHHRGFFLSLAFSSGLIISYTFIGILLGTIANVASKLVAVSEYLYLVLGSLMILGGLFFSGLVSFGKGGINTHCENAVKGVKSIPSAFIFGLVYAFLEMPACPCCGAVLLLIASLIAIKGSLLYAAVVFFSFALGQSLPIIVIGFSSALFKKFMPKTQILEGIISFIVGNILIVTGIFLVTIS
ncbi:MAG: sulfite exporter TauE/SafE family protein [Candidatus Omnitrophica bacterium]|nr:sulfite exporter TauE/SafE family protein [Candidatus Omnitrophota bacterium]MDE2008920.1 sulfite exporter TauE/SafE family protein [Candidatus Omnitrophota bacterium]MDE2213517.1 sulfite exporter TauE/SafE family protein [Candidatus Omnitrophota bacterium]MDE2230582.1 sulfite exporter TauE/SafE family protein [Candidatus Omnitrophota bacterium]